MADISFNENIKAAMAKIWAQPHLVLSEMKPGPEYTPTRAYQYLVKNERAQKSECLLENEVLAPFSPNAPPSRAIEMDYCIIRAEPGNLHYRFYDIDHFARWAQKQPQGQAYHEIIPGGAPCRLFMDLDCKDTVAGPEIIAAARSAVEAEFEARWGITPPVLVFQTKYPDRPGKLSAHIHVPGYKFKSSTEVRVVVEAIIARAGPLLAPPTTDLGPYRRNGSLRAPFSIKLGQAARKLPTFDCPGQPSYAPFALACARSLRDDFCLDVDIPAPIERPRIRPPDGLVARALALAADLGYTLGFEYSGQVDNFINFKRRAPSHCPICERTHDNDNTLFLTIGAHIKAHCRHAERGGVILGPGAPLVHDPWAQHPGRTEVTAQELPDLPGPGEFTTLAIRSLMGTGKTKALIRWIGALRPDQIVIVLSFRLTFTRDLAQKLPGFVRYDEISGLIYPSKPGRLIIQLESLHRLVLPDLIGRDFTLIMDESESIIGQWNSGNFKNFSAAWANFNGLMKAANRLIVMDAFLGARTSTVLTQLRPGPALFIDNVWRPKSAGRVTITYSGEDWRGKLTAAINSGKHVVVPCNTLSAARDIAQYLGKECPGKDIALYSSESDPGVKARAFSDIEANLKHDALIYTPTLSAGVSFEGAHYDAKFVHYSTASGADHMTTMQMLGRVRAITSGQISILVQKISHKVPLTEEALIRAITCYTETIHTHTGALAAEFDLTDPLRPKPKISPWIMLCVQNQLVLNRARTSPQFLVDLLRKSGYSIMYLKGPVSPMPALNLGEFAAQIASAQPISDEEFRALSDKTGRGLTMAELLSIKRYVLARFYGVTEVGPGFVKKFGRPEIIEIYRNRALSRGGLLPGQERRFHDLGRILHDGMEEASYKHALGLLTSLGYDGWASGAMIPKATLESSFDSWARALTPELKDGLENKYKVKVDRARFCHKMQLINKILAVTFDIGLAPIAHQSNGKIMIDGIAHIKGNVYIIDPSVMFGPDNTPVV